MILPLLKCPVGRIIGSTHNVWQEVFYLDGEEVGGKVSQGRGLEGCNRGNRVKPHCYYSSEEYPRARKCLFCSETNIFLSLLLPLLVYPPPVMGWVSEVEAPVCTWHSFSWCPPFPEPGGRGYGAKKIGWGLGGRRGPHLREDAAAPVWSCCFVPPQSAEIAQINLLFAWLGQYVCVLCACVCKRLLSTTFPFILIECSGVTTDECPRDYLHWVSQRPHL